MKRVNYDEVSAVYDRRYQAGGPAGIVESLREVARTANACRVVEVGCGTGHWLASLPEYEVRCGLDYSAGMLSKAQHKDGSVALVRGTAMHLPFPAGAFDMVFCVLICEAKGDIPLHLFDTFQGLPEPREADEGFFQPGWYGQVGGGARLSAGVRERILLRGPFSRDGGSGGRAGVFVRAPGRRPAPEHGGLPGVLSSTAGTGRGDSDPRLPDARGEGGLCAPRPAMDWRSRAARGPGPPQGRSRRGSWRGTASWRASRTGCST